MDTDIWILFGLLLFLIIGGGYFAASETAFATVNTLHIRQRAENGNARARHAEYILDHFNKALSTLLIGNNVMHIGTASISTYLVTKLWGEGYTAYSTIITTVVVFLVAEVIPKQLAKDKPEMMAMFFARTLVSMGWWVPSAVCSFLINSRLQSARRRMTAPSSASMRRLEGMTTEVLIQYG